jgi:ankyrin repeat protein
MEFQKSIHQQVLEKNFGKVQKSIQKGFVNQLDRSGFSPLLYAVGRQGDLEMARLLLENGANPNGHTRVGRVSCLHRAVLAGNPEIVELLLKFGADPLAIDLDNRTVHDCLKDIVDEFKREKISECLDSKLFPV